MEDPDARSVTPLGEVRSDAAATGRRLVRRLGPTAGARTRVEAA
ncbi:hypothetical protein [Actinomadura alba]